VVESLADSGGGNRTTVVISPGLYRSAEYVERDESVTGITNASQWLRREIFHGFVCSGAGEFEEPVSVLLPFGNQLVGTAAGADANVQCPQFRFVVFLARRVLVSSALQCDIRLMPPSALACLLFGISFTGCVQLCRVYWPPCKENPMSPRSWSVVAAIGLFAVLVPTAPIDAVGATTIIVGQNAAVCPGAQFAKIQDAVNAASPGDTIQICPGVYDEQVSISKALQVNGNNGATLRPSGAAANTAGLASGQSIAAILLIENTADVTIRNVTVDGTDADINACSPDLIGVFFRNASGQLSHVAVRNAKLSSNFSGCQSGSAILVQSGGGHESVVGIADSSIHAYHR